MKKRIKMHHGLLFLLLACLLFGSVTAVTAAGGVFVPTGSMNSPRMAHTATRLIDGKVLVAGGEDWGENAIDTAELYDPNTGSFSMVGAMNVRRVGHVATLLESGRVLITGGGIPYADNGHSLIHAASELFDPSIGQFVLSGNLQSKRCGNTATLLNDGTVLVAGGVDFSWTYGVFTVSVAELYSELSGAFVQTGAMVHSRQEHCATLLRDGKVLITGGSTVNGIIAKAELYDPVTGKFIETGDMNHPRCQHSAIRLHDGRVLVVGGNDASGYSFTDSAEIYDPVTGVFTPINNMHVARRRANIELLADGNVVIMGGDNGLYGGGEIQVVEVFDPSTGQFTQVGNLHSARTAAASALLNNGQVLITGGAQGHYSSTKLSSAELYIPISVNHSPVLTPIGYQTVSEGQALLFVVSAADSDGDVLTYTANNLPVGATFNPATRTFTWTPTYDQAGEYQNIEFVVSDNGSPVGTASEAIAITVGNVNRIPVMAAISDQQVAEGQSLHFQVSATDPDGDALSYSASNLPSGATFDPVTRIFSWTPTFEQAGEFKEVEFIAADGGDPVGTAKVSISIAVGNVNRSPVLSLIGNQSVLEGQLLTFQVSATDPDGNALSYSASNLPSGATFDPVTRIFNWTPTFDQANEYQNIEFSVTDNDLPIGTDNEAIIITVYNVNRPPVLNAIGNQQVQEGQLLQFQVSATDPDGDALVYSAKNMPSGAAFDSETRVFRWVPDFNESGEYKDVVFIVSDNGVPLELASEFVTINVGNVNRSPIFDTIGVFSLDGGHSLQFQVLATDPDGDKLTYSASNLPVGASFDPATRMFSWTPTYVGQDGNYLVRFNAGDDGEPSKTSQIEVSISVSVPTPSDVAGELLSVVSNSNLPTAVVDNYLKVLKHLEPSIEKNKFKQVIRDLNEFMVIIKADCDQGIISHSMEARLRDMALGIEQLLS